MGALTVNRNKVCAKFANTISKKKHFEACKAGSKMGMEHFLGVGVEMRASILESCNASSPEEMAAAIEETKKQESAKKTEPEPEPERMVEPEPEPVKSSLRSDPTPVEDEVAPVEDEVAPVEDEVAPVEDEVAPVEDEVAPTEEETTEVEAVEM